jgi:hypothetical protein
MKSKEEILNELLELSEKHFSEGDYLIAANLLKDLHGRKDSQTMNESEDEIDEQITNELNELQVLIQLRYLGYLGYVGYYGYIGYKRFCNIL